MASLREARAMKNGRAKVRALERLANWLGDRGFVGEEVARRAKKEADQVRERLAESESR